MPSHKQRLFYLDWVRALATVLIVITHFNNPVLTNRPAFPNAPFGIYIRDLGVSQFLIISGAALMYTYEDEEHLDLKRSFGSVSNRFTRCFGSPSPLPTPIPSLFPEEVRHPGLPSCH
nr:heparan-alpha-glucosaminide N-acetyltransferase domain-containing protein [Bifidobacterium indicum]